MDSHKRKKRTQSGSVAHIVERLQDILRKLTPKRREAMRKWCDAQETEDDQGDDPGGDPTER